MIQGELMMATTVHGVSIHKERKQGSRVQPSMCSEQKKAVSSPHMTKLGNNSETGILASYNTTL